MKEKKGSFWKLSLSGYLSPWSQSRAGQGCWEKADYRSVSVSSTSFSKAEAVFNSNGNSWVVVAHAFNPSTWEAEAGGISVRSTEQYQGYTEKPCLKQIK